MKNLLFRSFIIGCVFYVFSLIITLAFWRTWVSLVSSTFMVNEATFGNLILMFFVLIKLVLVFFMLVPAIAFQGMIHKKL